MTVLVRERAPLRLHATVTTGDGHRQRWASDERSPDNTLEQLSFSTVIPGGFEDASCVLQRRVDRDYPDLVDLETVQFRGAGGEIAGEFRLEGSPRDWGQGESSVSPQLVGWQNHLQDDSTAREIFLDSAFSDWQGASVQRQLDLLNAGINETDASSSADWSSGEPALATQLTGSWAQPSLSEAWYDAKGIPLGHLYCGWKLQAPDAIGDDVTSDSFWSQAAVLLDDDAAAGAYDSTPNLMGPGPTGFGVLDATTATRKFAAIYLLYNNAGGADGVNYPVFWTYLGVVGRHGCPIQGTFGRLGGIGLLASDIVPYAISRWAPKIGYTTGLDGSVQPSTFSIEHLVFQTAGTVADMITQATRFELLDWAVWEGPTYWQNDRGQSARTRNWRARIGPSKLQDAGPQIDRIWNQVLVEYADVTGVTRTVGPPGSGADTEDAALGDTDPENPANLAGVTRCSPLTMSTSTTAGAIQIGRAFLQEQKLLGTSGQASLTGHVEDDHGVLWPAWKVRAGDTITFVDAADPSPRRIVRTSYDDGSKTNSISLDSPPQGLQQLLERMSVALVPLGFS